MISFLFALLFTFNLYPAGFSGDTLLLTKNGQTTFEKIDYTIAVQSQHNSFQSIVFLFKQSLEKVVHISFADEVIICHKKQLFWCVNQHDWICAEDLKIGDLLQTINGQPIAIDAAQIITQQTEIYSLTVSAPYHLYVGKHGILAHNTPWVFAASASLAVSAGAVEFIKASIIPALSVIALKICDCFAKNRDKKKPKMAVLAKSSCRASFLDPNDNKNKYTYQNGIYEDADYHGSSPSGRKNPRPKDGQRALDNSIPVQDSPGQRVAIENDKIVTLQKTIDGKYHG